MPAAHQIRADGFTPADEVAQRLFLGTRNPDRVQVAGQQQPDEVLGVAAVGLDAFAGGARILLGAATTH